MHMNFEPSAVACDEIEFNDFLKVDIRIGEIIEVEDFPEARNPSYKIKINFGEAIGEKKTSAQITTLYTKESLIGKKVAAVVNFPKRQIGKFMSEVLLLGFSDSEQNVVLFKMDHEVPNGARLH